jgi:hypothetical protein
MDAKTKKAMAGILRQYGKALCELRAARDMLAFLAKNKKVLMEWERALEEVKTKPGYNRPARDLEIIALAFEHSDGNVDFRKLLQ